MKWFVLTWSKCLQRHWWAPEQERSCPQPQAAALDMWVDPTEGPALRQPTVRPLLHAGDYLLPGQAQIACELKVYCSEAIR